MNEYDMTYDIRKLNAH